MGVLASDTFTRANQSGGWGTSSGGDVWTVGIFGGAAQFSIASNEGVITGSTATQGAYLGTTTAVDMEVLVRFQITAAADQAFLFLRGTANNTQYRVRASGTLLLINKFVAGTNTQLTSVGVSISVATPYWLKGRVVGSNLYAKVWADGSGEPTNWTATATDGSITGAGKYGLAASPNVTTNSIKFDSLTINQAYGMQTQGQATFSVQMKLQDQGQSTFLTRMKERSSTRATFITRAALRTVAQSTFFTRMKHRSRAQSTFSTREKLFLPAQATFSIREKLRTPAQDIFQIREKLRTKTQASFQVRAKLHTQAQATFSIREKLRTPARALFMMRQKLLTQAQATFLIELIIALRTNPVTFPNQLGPYFYAGFNVVPISPPLLPYEVNGALLQTQPSLLTAPTTMAGNVLQAGSLFVLIFTHPDASTITALANGTQCQMTFGLPAGNMVTGTVSLASVLTGSMLQVVCTLTSPITLNQYVIQTPFW